ncbi:MAG: TrkA family potassium uptake protein [Chloroflexota bacterium]
MPYSQIVLPYGRTRKDRYLRMVRAIWHDTRALMTEFRLPIIAFLIATVGGGWAYGQLLEIYDPELAAQFSYFDYPWMMAALMVLEPVHDVPNQLPLIIFWYMMPLLAIYVIGQGAVDFLRLFFNRSDRRDAWEEAVASTYRNHVIIIGLGHVGSRVTYTLVTMGFEVVAIDKEINEELDKRLNSLGVPSIIGDARSQDVLEKAGIRRAASMIVATSNDHVNLETIMRARDMNEDMRIVARMFDPQFSRQLNQFMGVQATLSSSDLSAPAFAGAAVGIEITQTLTIGGMEYSMIRLDVAAGSIFAGVTIDRLQDEQNMDIVLYGRDDNMTVHPQGDILVGVGDTLVLFAEHHRVMEIVSQNRPDRKQLPR